MRKRVALRRLVSRVLIGSMLLTPHLLPTPAHASETTPPNVVIGEVAWAGSSLSTADEWFEVWNRGDVDVSLANWLVRGAGESSRDIPFPSSAMIPAHTAYLVANYATTDTRSAVAIMPNMVTTTVALSNSTLKMELIDASGVVVDSVGTGGLPPAGASLPIKASMVRSLDGVWATSTQQVNFKTGITDLGTPGVCDACTFPATAPTPEPAPTPVEEPATTDPGPTTEPVPTNTTSTSDPALDSNTGTSTDTGTSTSDPTTVTEPTTSTDTPTDSSTTSDTSTTSGTDSTGTTSDATTPSEVTPTDPAITGSDAPAADASTSSTETSTEISSDPVIPGDGTATSNPENTTDAVSSTTDDTVEETPAIAPDETASTSTVETATPTEETSTSTDTPATETSSTEAVVEPLPAPTPTPTPTPEPTPSILRLNEIFPAPVSGKEWIELSLTGDQIRELEGYKLYDASGKIYTFPNTTFDPAQSRYLVVELSSSKLNNGGDSVLLYDASNQLLDAVQYPETTKGHAWIRFPEPDGSWQETLQATPRAPNVLKQETTETPTSTSPLPAPQAATSSIEHIVNPPKPPTKITTSSTTEPKLDSTVMSLAVAMNMPAQKSTVTLTSSKTQKSSSTKKKAEPKKTTVQKTSPARKSASVAKKATTTKTKSSSKSSSSKKPTTPPTLISLDMLSSLTTFPESVLLIGTVGSSPGLISGHTFILLSDEGRGIQVTVPKALKLPVLGEHVQVTGKLEFRDDNTIYLKMSAKDAWQDVSGTVTPTPRIVDLLLPSAEDAWSFVQVTGTVMETTKTQIKLDLEDAELTVVVRPNVDYRTARLKKGDLITVMGVIDTKGDTKLLPRNSQEITLIKHAESLPPAKAASTSLPGWTPLGAAMGAIGATEGYKRLRKRLQMRELQKRMESLSLSEQSS
jgi:hypothetical protein